MTTKDPKKTNMQERHEIAGKIKNIRNSDKDTETKKKEISGLLLWKQVTEMKQESREIAEKIPELEYTNYKIDENMTIEEKLQNWRKKEENVLINIFYNWRYKYPSQIKTTVLEKDLGNNAYVWEYLDGLPRKYVGEQKFNREAVKKLWLVDKLPKNYQEFEKIVWPHKAERRVSGSVVWHSRLEEYYTPEYKNFLQKYFSKNGNIVFSGFRMHKPKNITNWIHFSHLALLEILFLWDGSLVDIAEDYMCLEKDHRGWGYSLRFVKK